MVTLLTEGESTTESRALDVDPTLPTDGDSVARPITENDARREPPRLRVVAEVAGAISIADCNGVSIVAFSVSH